jgi:alkylation response protein AidB-like acyl-CoA dehydrogenase
VVPLAITQVKDQVEATLALVAEQADEAERTRRLPDQVVDTLRRTGINRLALPAALGGLQAPVLDMFDVVERIAAVDGSTAWCTLIGFGSNVFGGYMPEAGARTVFADPDQGNATMFAPTGRIVPVGDGRGNGRGHRLTGRWPFTSNCLHSAWVGLGAMLHGPDGSVEPVPRVAFVPVGGLAIGDDWDGTGLRGTGSHQTTADDVPVDLDHTCTFVDRPWADGTLWRTPLYTALVPLLAAVPLGVARGAVDEIVRQAGEGRSARRGQVTDDPISLADLARIDTRLRSARAGLRTAVAEVQERAERGDPVDKRLQARTALASLDVCDVSVEVTSVAHQLGGGAAAYAGSRLLRALGDVHAARQHLLFAPKHRVQLARALVGEDVVYPPFIF